MMHKPKESGFTQVKSNKEKSKEKGMKIKKNQFEKQFAVWNNRFAALVINEASGLEMLMPQSKENLMKVGSNIIEEDKKNDIMNATSTSMGVDPANVIWKKEVRECSTVNCCRRGKWIWSKLISSCGAIWKGIKSRWNGFKKETKGLKE